MNHVFRVIWNHALQTWQAVSETACARGKAKSDSRRDARRAVTVVGALFAVAAAGPALAQVPTGGQVVGGTGTITTSGNAMVINQSSNRLALDWQAFSIGSGSSVRFIQPGAASVALNRVLGSEVSVIQGALSANGQVFLVNPNGVLFTPTAQVNVGGLVASTLAMSPADFMAGNYRFQGGSTSSVVNQGQVTATGDGAGGGFVGLLAAKVVNDGTITATGGNVVLAAASDVTLDLGGPVKLQVSKGAIDAQVANGGAVVADGGTILLTAHALDALTTSVVNQTGVVRARTLAGEKGSIKLIADAGNGTVNASGTLDASAPSGGDGGFIETSAADVRIAPDLVVTTVAGAGLMGRWLIDPDIVEIVTGGAGTLPLTVPSTGTTQIAPSTLVARLATTTVDLQANKYVDVKNDVSYTGGPTPR